MPGIDLRQVRHEITIRQVLDLLGFVPTARCGPRLRGPCPIHGDYRQQSRGFSVHLGCHRYRCFRCHSAGTQLDLWAAVHDLGIYATAGISVTVSASRSRTCLRAASATIPAGNRLTSGRRTGSTSGRRRQDMRL